MHNTLTKFILGSLSLLTDAFPSNLGSSDVAAPLSKRYASGWCGVHVIQYQKNEGPGDQSVYRFDVKIYDADQTEIGDVALPSPASVDSALPYTLEIAAGNVDQDPVTFAYAGQTWLSDGETCSFGKYDSGSRQGDCGFNC